MTSKASSTVTKTVNFAVGFALLAMLFPVGGHYLGKPAGVRTAVEMIANKPSLRKAADELTAR